MDATMDVTMDVVVASVAGVVSLAAIITLAVLLVVSRRQLAAARRELERSREQSARRRRRLGIAPLAIRTAWNTADSLMKKGLGATVRNSIEDLAGWARVERPELARLTADGEVVIAFSDIEGSTELNEALGDREWVKVLARHSTLVHKLVEHHGGHVVKNQGDGFMVAFADPVEAVRWGVELQQALAADGKGSDGGGRRPLRVRIGIHMGTSVRRGDDLFGLDVATAARVAEQARGGEVLVSQSVRDAIQDSSDITIGPARDVDLKGLTGNHEVFECTTGISG